MKTPLKKPTTKTNVPVRTTNKEEKVASGPITDTLSKKPIKKTKVLWKTTPKKKPTRTATARQKKAIDILDKKGAKGGKIVLADIAREAGYSESIAREPKRIFWSEIVQKELKKIWVDGTGRKLNHEYLMNTRLKHVMRYPSDIDPKSVIKRYTAEFPWFRCFHYELIGDFYEFECSMPNDANIRSALEFSFKHFPVIPEQRKESNGKSKRLLILEELAEKKGLHLKNPIKLWTTENLSQSQNLENS